MVEKVDRGLLELGDGRLEGGPGGGPGGVPGGGPGGGPGGASFQFEAGALPTHTYLPCCRMYAAQVYACVACLSAKRLPVAVESVALLTC